MSEYFCASMLILSLLCKGKKNFFFFTPAFSEFPCCHIMTSCTNHRQTKMQTKHGHLFPEQLTFFRDIMSDVICYLLLVIRYNYNWIHITQILVSKSKLFHKMLLLKLRYHNNVVHLTISSLLWYSLNIIAKTSWNEKCLQEAVDPLRKDFPFMANYANRLTRASQHADDLFRGKTWTHFL